MSSLFGESRWLSTKYYKCTDDEVRIILQNAEFGQTGCNEEDPLGMSLQVRERRWMYDGLIRECREELDYRNQYDTVAARSKNA